MEISDADLQLALALSASESSTKPAPNLAPRSDPHPSDVEPSKEPSAAAIPTVCTVPDALQTARDLDRMINSEYRQKLRSRKRETAPSSPTRVARVHKRSKGKNLTNEEMRMVRHTYAVCVAEKNKSLAVSTKNPFLRTSIYLGLGERTVRNVLNPKKINDETFVERGKYARYPESRLFAADLRSMTVDLNLRGLPVTTSRLRKKLEENWKNVDTQRWGTVTIPSKETIRRILLRMHFTHGSANRAKSFVDTDQIRRMRHHYVRTRMDPQYKDHLFVWQDESYCHHHHVRQQTWITSKTDVVKRQGKGRRYIICHAGSKLGWIGEPMIWVAGTDSEDYHKNMNAKTFIKYFERLCKWCVDAGHKKVVFVLDNAKYHRCERVPNDDDDDDEDHSKTLSQMRKSQLIDRLVERGAGERADLATKLKKELYEEAKKPKYQRPPYVEVIAKSHGYEVLWLPPYHPDLNPIEEAWGLTKQHVAYNNDGTFSKIPDLIREGFEVAQKAWPSLVVRTVRREIEYQNTENIMSAEAYERLQNFRLIIDLSDTEDDEERSENVGTEESQSLLDALDDGLNPMVD